LNRTGLFPVFAFPVHLAVGILLIPVNPDYNDHAMAVQAVQQTVRWFAGHLIAAIAFGFVIWAIRELLSILPGAPWYTLVFTAIGAGLYAAGMGADGIAPMAVMTAGESARIFFDGSSWWISGVFMAGTIFFAVGLFIITGNAIQVKLVEGICRYIIFISALIFITAPAIPSGWALYGIAAAAFGIFFPIGAAIHRKKLFSRSTGPPPTNLSAES